MKQMFHSVRICEFRGGHGVPPLQFCRADRTSNSNRSSMCRLLSEKAVYIHPKRSAAVKHRCCQPCLSAAFDELLQALL